MHGRRHGGIKGVAQVVGTNNAQVRGSLLCLGLERVGDARARRAEADGDAGLTAAGLGEAREISALVVAAEHHDNGLGREGGEGLLDRVGVRGLGVVDEVHARDLATGLDAVLDGVEPREPARHDSLVDPHEQRERGGREGVLPVVASANPQVVDAAEVVLDAA